MPKITIWLLTILLQFGSGCHQPIPEALNTCKLTEIITDSPNSTTREKTEYDYMGKEVKRQREYKTKDGTYHTIDEYVYTYDADQFITSEKNTYTNVISGYTSTDETIYHYDQGRIALIDHLSYYDNYDLLTNSEIFYYSGNQLSKIQNVYSSGWTITYYFDNGVLVHIHDSNSLAYYSVSNGNIVTEYQPNQGYYYTYEYDSQGRKTKEELFINGALQYSGRLSYDDALNPLSTRLHYKGFPQLANFRWSIYRVGYGKTINNVASYSTSDGADIYTYTYNNRNLPIKSESNYGQTITYSYSDCQ